MEAGLSIGDIVLVKHYSLDISFKCKIKEVNKYLVIIEPPINHDLNISIFNLFENDPLVIISEKNKEVIIYESIIVKIDFSNNFFHVNLNNFQSFENKRLFERFPTSIYIEVILHNSNKRNIAIIKNISETGACIISKTLYEIGTQIEFYFILEKTIVKLNAEIIRQLRASDYYEYGLVLIFNDPNIKELIKDYIVQLKSKLSLEIDSLH